jgi:hypothetical protein
MFFQVRVDLARCRSLLTTPFTCMVAGLPLVERPEMAPTVQEQRSRHRYVRPKEERNLTMRNFVLVLMGLAVSLTLTNTASAQCLTLKDGTYILSTSGSTGGNTVTSLVGRISIDKDGNVTGRVVVFGVLKSLGDGSTYTESKCEGTLIISGTDLYHKYWVGVGKSGATVGEIQVGAASAGTLMP